MKHYVPALFWLFPQSVGPAAFLGQAPSLGVPILLELISSLGALPFKEGDQDRASMASPGIDLECGVKTVKLHSVYPLPATPSQAIADLAIDVTYWQGLADRVLNAREYIEEVDRVRQLVETIRPSDNVRVTLYNETLKDHVKHKGNDLAFASDRIPDNSIGFVEPPSYVWLTSEARAEEQSLGILQKEATEQFKSAVTAGAAATVCLSAPLYLPLGEDTLAPKEMLTASSSPPAVGAPWAIVDLLLCLVGSEHALRDLISLETDTLNAVAKATGQRPLNQITKFSYYSSLGMAVLGRELFQSRILTKALFLAVDGNVRPEIWSCVRSAVKTEPLTTEIQRRYRQRQNAAGWGGFNEADNAQAIVLLDGFLVKKALWCSSIR